MIGGAPNLLRKSAPPPPAARRPAAVIDPPAFARPPMAIIHKMMEGNMTQIFTATNAIATQALIARGITLDAKILEAERRSFHSFFDIHVIENDEGSYSLLEEGDYGTLPLHIIDSIVYTADAKMSDEY